MTIRIIESVAAIAARQPGISQLPAGVYYTDPVHGLVVDYVVDSVPAELLPITLYACEFDGSAYSVVKAAPSDFTAAHTFAGWPVPGEVIEPPAEPQP